MELYVWFRVGYHFAEPMREEMRELYDVRKGKWSEEPVLRSGCGAAAETKRESIRDMKWRPADRRTGGRAKQIRMKRVKQEGVSIRGTDRVTGFQKCEASGMKVDEFGFRSGEVRNSSMEK